LSTSAARAPGLRSLGGVLERGRALALGGPALREGDRELDYDQFEALVARLTGALGRIGVRERQRVAVWLPKSIEAVAVMQATLRLGAAYVPVDPLSPAARVRQIVAGCRPVACVALAERAEDALGGELSRVGLLTLSRPGGEWIARRAGRPADDSDPSLAYVLYTSGSTGTPKGVCISHRNALAFVEWARDEVAPRPGERFAAHAPLHFDLSVFDLYVALLSGGCACLVPEAISFLPARLVAFVRRERIAIWYEVPSALMLMERAGLLDDPPPSLRAILFAGEPFPIDSLRRLRRALPGARLLNLYGPTETNVCSFHEVGEIGSHAELPVPIGRAACGDSIWIEDTAGKRLPVGARGELVVSGPTVMLGYWDAPPWRGPYRTGDIAERISADSYRYVGRLDSMVKVRGHRVELGEVEAAIAGDPAVGEVAVVVLGEGLEAQLVAAVVPREGAEPELLELKRRCAERLPRYMVVHGMRALGELPRNRNGKVDRRRLAAQLAEGAVR
jgi:amino acid adenylation domain-containing protein